ncbi:cbb3-type cytochrome oxidase assembly protein CcoS [uncultured Roseobacter sp.]|uniref:cbb3-type cytochrome oxidase assembly protein CcoS n=1 Tax=uncultured Roseobacter sp. TaxID=114847 RepID=UPI002612A6C3|nr:cbb3-type cytochrome oxidase assembly protein CcoS [uncultured Roseobacter sp.]
MNAALYLIPISLVLAVCALAAFIWTVRTGQYDDVEGDSARMLDAEDKPLTKRKPPDTSNH